ncbi:MAG: ferritin family protein [Candidatus Omnitrophota bacterium]|jgi:VIT1/CCC1 family predicted Fe2+/Mn2+ transporter|nr:ferritin family protein [Candidatus Omnitrophota bacterium]
MKNIRIKEYIFDEYADCLLYKDLASREKNPHNKSILIKLSDQEHLHYLFWKKMMPDYEPDVGQFFLLRFRLLRRLTGLTFTIKFLERHEHIVVKEYERVLETLSGDEKTQLEEIIRDEKEHENFFIGQVQETVIQYIGFIALGLADAIVEITGVHAGFLGVTNSTLFAGISGLIVGFSAAISMGSAAYLQAKQESSHRSPWVSAIATTISYIASVILLAVPYFLTQNMGYAFTLSIGVGMGLIALLTFYSAIVFDKKFLREFLETTILMLLTAAATFLLGTFLGKTFGIRHGSGLLV